MLSLLLLFITSLLATTTVTSVQVTSTQAILRISTDQGGSCSFKVSEVNDFGGGYVPVHDVNTSLFSGSDQCSRAGNIESTGYKVLVIGKRTAEVASNRRYSRALAANTRHYYQLSVGSDTVTGQFVTGNITLGNTRNDSRFDRSRPGEYNFPSIDWADKTKSYVDPTTGLKIKRVSGPGELIPTTNSGRAFDVINGTGWSGGSYSGTSQGYLYLRAQDPSPGFTIWQSFDAAQLVATLSGTQTPEVCITNNGVTCAGGTLTQAITGSPTAYTIGTSTPILESWRNSPVIPSRIVDVMPATGTLTKSGTTLTWASGRLFPAYLVAGSLITIGSSTDCAIAAFTNEKSLTLSSSGCVADGTHNFTIRTWGFLVRAATNASGTITVTSPTWTSHATGSAYLGTSGHFRLCSPVKVNGPTGPGQVCATGGAYAGPSYGSSNPIYWFGDDGTVNQVGLSGAPVGSTGLSSALCGRTEGLVWDRTTAGKFYCLGYVGPSRYIFSITYSGDYSNQVVDFDELLPNSVAALEGSSLTSMVTAFTASQPIKFADAPCTENQWQFYHRQVDDLIMFCHVGQEYPAWLVVFNTTSKTVIAAMTTWGGSDGMPNRWGGLHSVNVAGDQRWVSVTYNPLGNYYLGRQSAISSGTLTSSFSPCPANPIDPSLEGLSQCSTVTVANIIPLNTSTGTASKVGATLTWVSGNPFPAQMVPGQIVTLGSTDCALDGFNNTVNYGAINITSAACIADGTYTFTIQNSVYGQPFKAGDGAIVYASGVDDEELIRILSVSGTTLVVQRDYRPYWRQGAPTKTNHTGSLALMAYPGAYKEMWWDYVSDPHGQDATGTYVFEDPDSANCHQLNEFGIFIIACLKTVYIPGVVFRNGWMPASASNTDIFEVNWDAFFAGSSYIINILNNESHPSSGQYIASDYEKLRWFDARPYSGEILRITNPANVSNVSGQLWKVAAAATSSTQYRLQGFIGLTGPYPLVDASPEVLATDSSDNYKFCYVVIANDCRSGSVAGEIYFNVPFLTVQGWVNGRFAPFPGNEERDVTFTQNTHTAGTLLQASSQRLDVYGQTVRRLTTAFGPHKEQSTFWNYRPLPDSSRIFFVTRQVDMVRDQVLTADLPPYPPEDSISRGVFVPVSIKLSGVSGDEIRIRFGYSENGAATSLYCHERQVSCATNAANPQSPLWTDETQSWQACDTGCEVKIPAIGGRVVYYIIDRKNGSTTTSSTIEAIAVP